jgi:hypothetical protein
MTQPTSNRGWAYPTEYLDPWYDELFDMFEEIDQDIQDLIDGKLGNRQRAVIDYVDNTAAPPTENDGDRYILNMAGGGVHADWDGASAGDIVQFDVGAGTWSAVSPVEGYVSFVDLQNVDYRYVDDGTPGWEAAGGGETWKVWNGSTADDTETEIFLGGVLNSRESVSPSSTKGFLITLTARDNANNESKRWRIEGAVQRDGSDNTSLVSAPMGAIVAESAGALAWAQSVEADDTNEALIIKVTGEIGKTITWLAKGKLDVVS